MSDLSGQSKFVCDMEKKKKEKSVAFKLQILRPRVSGSVFDGFRDWFWFWFLVIITVYLFLVTERCRGGLVVFFFFC